MVKVILIAFLSTVAAVAAATAFACLGWLVLMLLGMGILVVTALTAGFLGVSAIVLIPALEKN